MKQTIQLWRYHRDELETLTSLVIGCFANEVAMDRQVCTQLMRKNDAVKATRNRGVRSGVEASKNGQNQCQTIRKWI